MALFTATFGAVAVSAAQDVFELVTAASTRVALWEIRLGQYSGAGDAAAEMISLQVLRGYTVSGSGGSAVVPEKVEPWGAAATSTVEANNTTVANTTTPALLLADSFNIQAGFLWQKQERSTLLVPASTRLVVRITLPADALTMNGTLVFEEFNTGPYAA